MFLDEFVAQRHTDWADATDFSDFFWSDPLSKNQENQKRKSEKSVASI